MTRHIFVNEIEDLTSIPWLFSRFFVFVVHILEVQADDPADIIEDSEASAVGLDDHATVQFTIEIELDPLTWLEPALRVDPRQAFLHEPGKKK